MCASCSSLADGMKESGLRTPPEPTPAKTALLPNPQSQVPHAPETAVLDSDAKKEANRQPAEDGSVKTNVAGSNF